jgi:hypothetical protein
MRGEDHRLGWRLITKWICKTETHVESSGRGVVTSGGCHRPGKEHATHSARSNDAVVASTVRTE